ncbi:MAG: hypothetical protein EAZ10_04720, partial [Oscillatoriales cyanobacterium]
GLQFWRQYMEPHEINAYFRFDTSSIFDGESQSKKIPQNFFDFIVISHCFFNDEDRREKSHRIYKDIFTNCLTDSGYVLLIIQEKKLIKPYNIRQIESCEQELSVVKQFLDDVGLNLVWYTAGHPIRILENLLEKIFIPSNSSVHFFVSTLTYVMT